MPKPKSSDRLAAFAERLIEICTDKGLPARGRQTQLAKIFGITQQAARKWLDGVNYPSTETIEALADWGEVNVNWLWQGAGPKKGNRIDAKVLLLDEALHVLPPESGADFIDNLRAKLVRAGKLSAGESPGRYEVMLTADERELAGKRRQ